jgi:peptide/nickel transport system permease protein
MLTDARDYIFRAPWLAVFPGIAIGLTVLSFNLLGDTLAEGLEPRSR